MSLSAAGLVSLLFGSATVAAPVASCPADMQLVSGVHAEQVQKLCRKTVYDDKCVEYLPGLVMTEPRYTPVNTCMDRYEWPNRAGADPVVMLRFVDAEKACAGRGKRLCTEFEWEVACEGPERWPWPYGWKKRDGFCHVDKPYRAYDEGKINSSNAAVRDHEVQRLWQGAKSGSHPKCTSPHGIDDMVGNVEEWVITSRPEWPYRSGLKGGYWSKSWAGCRGTNEGHSPMFRYYEIGFRCCRDPEPK
jgi:formylglycine-generating enzyme required for sulfatase activity